MHTISECLATLQVTTEALEACAGSIKLEFGVIKKAYFKVQYILSFYHSVHVYYSFSNHSFMITRYTLRQKVLVCHPDKGGDPAVFRTVHASFETLRDMYDNERIVGSFLATNGETPVEMNVNDDVWQEYADMPPQSWEYFYEAAEEQVPGYSVELAKSGRSSCKMEGARKKCDDPTIATGRNSLWVIGRLFGNLWSLESSQVLACSC